MGIIDPTTGREIRRADRSLLYGIAINLESGSAEFFCNGQLMERLPLAERKRIVDACLSDIKLAFKVPSDA